MPSLMNFWASLERGWTLRPHPWGQQAVARQISQVSVEILVKGKELNLKLSEVFLITRAVDKQWKERNNLPVSSTLRDNLDSMGHLMEASVW